MLVVLLVAATGLLNTTAVDADLRQFLVLISVVCSLAKLEAKVKGDFPQRRENVLQALKNLDNAMKE